MKLTDLKEARAPSTKEQVRVIILKAMIDHGVKSGYPVYSDARKNGARRVKHPIYVPMKKNWQRRLAGLSGEEWKKAFDDRWDYSSADKAAENRESIVNQITQLMQKEGFEVINVKVADRAREPYISVTYK